MRMSPRKIDDNHFEVEIGVMKMKIARDDVAEVINRGVRTPVQAARARGISVSLQQEDVSVPSEINVIGRPWMKRRAKWKGLWIAHFWLDCRGFASCTAAGWGFSAKRCGSICRSIRMWRAVTEPPQNEGGGGATVVELKV